MDEEKAVRNVAKRIGLITNVVCLCAFIIICYITRIDFKFIILIFVGGLAIGLILYYPIYRILRKRMHD